MVLAKNSEPKSSVKDGLCTGVTSFPCVSVGDAGRADLKVLIFFS